VSSCTPGHVPSLKIAPLHGGSGPHLLRASLGPPESITQTASRLVQPFLHSSRQVSSGMPGHDLSPKIAPSLLIHAFLGPPVSTAYFKEHLGQFSRLCTAHVRMSLVMSGHMPFPSILPTVRSGPPSNTWFFGSTRRSIPNNISVQPFLHSSLQTDSPYTLQWALPKIAPSHGVIWTPSPSNTRFLGPIQAHNPDSISIVSAVFAQLTAECPYKLQLWAATLFSTIIYQCLNCLYSQ